MIDSLNFIKTSALNRIRSFSNSEVLFDCKKFPQSNLSIEDRMSFRHFLIEKIKSHKEYKKRGGPELKELLKIGVKPCHPLLAVSISHCKNLAFFAAKFFNQKQSSLSIGLDIEKKDRVSHKIISRFSSVKEMQDSPSLGLLWTAKEASFKCFYQEQEQFLVRDFLISSWMPIKSFKDSFTFKSQYKDRQVLGLAFNLQSFSFSYVEKI